jgi:hypothetical protein
MDMLWPYPCTSAFTESGAPDFVPLSRACGGTPARPRVQLSPLLSVTANEEKTICWVNSGDGAGAGSGVNTSAGSGSAVGADEGELRDRTTIPANMTNTATPTKIKGTLIVWEFLFSIRQPH